MIVATLPLSLILSVVVAVILPLVVGIVTTRVTSSALKGVLLTALSVLAGVLTEAATAITNGEPYDIGVSLLNTVLALGVAQASYSALWKPTGAAKALQEVGTPYEQPEQPEQTDHSVTVESDDRYEHVLEIDPDENR